jgi:hypothetical protein
MPIKTTGMIKKIKSFVLLLTLFLLFILPISKSFSVSNATHIYPGNLTLKCINTEKETYLYKVWLFSDNQILIKFNNSLDNLKIIAKTESGDQINVVKKENNLFIMSEDKSGYIYFSIVSPNQSENLKLTYSDPCKALVSFARTYQEFSIQWQKRIYIENYISPIKGNIKKYPENNYEVNSTVSFGAPYSWGGKDFPENIASKIKANGSVQTWREYYNDKTKHPTNLDANESMYDFKKGPENPSKWAGVDCSGLVEKSSYLAGLVYDYKNAPPKISKGDFRGAKNFTSVKEGDIFVLLRDNTIVHFGIISKKGPTINTTFMIHSAWFTSLRYNTNGPLKVIETSIGEFSSLYSWEIIRFNEK